MLGLVAIILIWVWRNKKNGNGNGSHAKTIADSLQMEQRMILLEKDVAVIKDSLKGIKHWMDQNTITRERMASEQGEIRGRLGELVRRLDTTPPTGN